MPTEQTMQALSQVVTEAQALVDNTLNSEDRVLWDERLAITALVRDLSIHVKQLQLEVTRLANELYNLDNRPRG